jgi:tetratricopeptide (TPR) repeat protein
MLTFSLPLLWSAAAFAQSLTVSELIWRGNEATRGGRSGDAERYLRTAIESADFSKVPLAEQTLALTDFGQVLANSEDYDRAEEMLTRALEIQRNNPGADPRYLPVVLNNLGMVYQATGRYGRSESVLLEAKDLIEREPGGRHPILSHVLNNLGSVYRDTNRSKSAERAFDEALAVAQDAFGANYDGLIPILNNLAGIARSDKKWERAETLLMRALQVASESVHPEHPWIGLAD